MSIATPLYGPSTPFFTGTIATSTPQPDSVFLAGRDYPIDLPNYRNNGIESIRTNAVQSGEPADDILDPRGAWWRYRPTNHYGAGQEVADFGDDVEARQFWRSRGVDPWDEFCMKLHEDTEEVLSCSASVLPMVATDGFVYVGDGTGVQRSSDLSTWNAVTGLSGTVRSIDTDGTDTYIATSTGVYVVDPSGLAATLISPADDVQKVGFAANRLLAGRDNVLSEVQDPYGTPAFDDIWTHFQASFRWTAIFNVGSRIYAGGYAGNRSELFSIQTNDSGDLVRAQEAAPFAFGELLNGAVSYGGAIVLLTSLGVRFAQIGGDGSLTYGPLITAGGDVKCATAEGNFAWFGWSDYPDAGSGLGRLALDRFVDTLQPAYAADIFTEAASADVVSCARFGGRTLFAVAGDAVYASDPGVYVVEGWWDTGRFYFGTVEAKKLTEILVSADALDTNDGIDVSVVDQADTEVGTAAVSTATATGLTVDLDGVSVFNANVRFTLTSDGTSTPCVKFWRMRAYPVAPSTEEWVVPLIIKSHVVVGDGQGQVQSFDVLAEVERLKDLWRNKTVVGYREGSKSYRVRIDNFQVQAHDWRDSSDYFEVHMIVNLISV